MSSNPTDHPGRVRRGQLWLLVVIFFVPLVTAFIVYYGVGWRPSGTTNKGDLISPARPLPTNVLVDAQDQPLEPNYLKGKWSLVYIGDGQCDARCREALTLTRQTRLALNDDAQRVQRVLLSTAHCCDLAYLNKEHGGLILARVEEASDRALLNEFPRYEDVPVETAGRIYVVDPLGNLMMSYAPDAPQKGVLEDLRKLLKLSHIG